MIVTEGKKVQKYHRDHSTYASYGPVEAQDHKYTNIIVQS